MRSTLMKAPGFAVRQNFTRGWPSLCCRHAGTVKNLGETYVMANEPISGLPQKKPFTVLGIETSCDDTGAAVVRSDGVILGEALKSQHEIHASYGGVVPSLARDAHQDYMDRVVDLALERAGLNFDQVDAFAATVGPGLEICLRVGARTARELARRHDKPFVAVHHIEAHCLMARPHFITDRDEPIREDASPLLPFPFLALVVSGGHSQILYCEGVGKYTVLGSTLDDALGEAYDKIARLLGHVGSNGGPHVEMLARHGNHKNIPLPVPMKHRKDCDFSYAGLKNSFRIACGRQMEASSTGELSEATKADLAASFQHSAIKHLTDRIERAFAWMDELGTSPVTRTLVVVGGVASNSEVRSRLERTCIDAGWKLVAPPPHLCTDNGVMAAWTAVEKLSVGVSDEIEAGYTGDVHARWQLGSELKR